MESIAQSYLQNGDVASALRVFSSLEVTQPRVSRLTRFCRVLADPSAVPVPHRFVDICEAILEKSLPLGAFFGAMETEEETLRQYNKLLLLVHPDKNPCTNATAAFVRLKAGKEAALAEVHARRERAARQRASDMEYERLQSTLPDVERTKPGRRSSKDHDRAPGSVSHYPTQEPSQQQRLRRKDSRTAASAVPQHGDAATSTVPPLKSKPPQQAQPPPNSQPLSSQPTPRRALTKALSDLKLHRQQVVLSCSFKATNNSTLSPLPQSSDDSEEETLICTVSSTLSTGSGNDVMLPHLSPTGSGVVKATSSTVFVLPSRDATSVFANAALSGTRAIWADYHSRQTARSE